MFHTRTLFVVEAGELAAAVTGKKTDIRFGELNRPVGGGDLQLFAQITNMRSEANDIQLVGWLIRDGITLSQSIDNFLNLHRPVVEMNERGFDYALRHNACC